ncbi:hypothetical protein SK128_003645 [Halocaridina rubra]|uniref:FAD-binding PCMH-type domain-containing protein n=1 Tax=Halocaridina rubra TaxID=373956 RepID=A0AAN8WIB6_HALRR
MSYAGVDVKYKNQEYSVLIQPTNVPELTKVSVQETGIVIGASVTLTKIEETLKHLINTLPEHSTRIYASFVEMLRWFAGKQIRNAAAIGGNIMTGSPISDLIPLLMASRSILTLCSEARGERQVEMNPSFFTGYRQNIAHSDEILLSVHIPVTEKDEYFYGYKQSRRRDDDIAIVNAGMRVRFESDSIVVKNLDLAFGGMAPTTVMAPGAMKELSGMAWESSLLEKGTDLILKDLPLSPSAPGGMIEYRRALTLSFFFKFYLSVRSQLAEKLPKLVPPLTSDEQKAIRPSQLEIPKSTQLFQKVPTHQSPLDPIGRPILHASALKQATGEAVYVDDIPHFENELYAGYVLSTRANAKIISIDESEALKVEGVRRFFCARDVPGERNMTGSIAHDEYVFAPERVTCVGQLIGMVVACDQLTAQRAAKLVKIQYEDIKPLIITIQASF